MPLQRKCYSMIFELKEELKEFCQLKNKMMYYSWPNDKQWILLLAYLHDIFEQLNKLNLQIQRKDINIITFVDALEALKSKLANWKNEK